MVGVCMRLHLCVRGRRLREGGGVVGNRSFLQMLQGRRSEWKVLRLSAVRRSGDSRRRAAGGPRPDSRLRSRFAERALISSVELVDSEIRKVRGKIKRKER